MIFFNVPSGSFGSVNGGTGAAAEEAGVAAATAIGLFGGAEETIGVLALGISTSAFGSGSCCKCFANACSVST